jgi:hypothetical protein
MPPFFQPYPQDRTFFSIQANPLDNFLSHGPSLFAFFPFAYLSVSLSCRLIKPQELLLQKKNSNRKKNIKFMWGLVIKIYNIFQYKLEWQKLCMRFYFAAKIEFLYVRQCTYV